MSPVTRRQLIRTGVVAGGGALLGTTAVLQRPAGRARDTASAESVSITAAGMRLQSPNFRKGRQPESGERILITGQLFDSSGETALGDLYGVYIAIGGGGAAGDGPASLEQHTFAFADGTLLGSGAATRDVTREDSFAIVGGTGAYAGASGTYTARQGPIELGGDGTAEFVIQLA